MVPTVELKDSTNGWEGIKSIYILAKFYFGKSLIEKKPLTIDLHKQNNSLWLLDGCLGRPVPEGTLPPNKPINKL